MSGQRLTTLPESVFSRTDITVLNVSNNQLAALPASISRMNNLVELRVENNHFETLPPEISKLKNLRKLHDDENSMPVRVQHLLWGDDKWLSTWLKDGRYPKKQLLDIIHDHIMAVGQRYMGKVSTYSNPTGWEMPVAFIKAIFLKTGFQR